MQRDVDQVYIALGTREGVQTYTLVHRNKRLKSYPSVAEAVLARTELEKQLEEAK